MMKATDSLQKMATELNEEMKENRGETYMGDVDEEKATLVGFGSDRGRTSAWNNDMDEGKNTIAGFKNSESNEK